MIKCVPKLGRDPPTSVVTAAAIWGSASFTDCRVYENVADNGGGVFIKGGGSANFTKCVLYGNVVYQKYA